MIKFSSIKKLGKRPPAVRSHEEARKRIEEMRSWTSGPINSALSWLVQVGLASVIFLYLKIFNKVKVFDRKKLKQVDPPYLFVSNHLTMFDDFFIGALLFLPYAFRSRIFFPWHAPEEQNFFLGPIITWILKKAQCVPLTRGHGLFQPGMTRLKELLKEKNIVHIYPEGTRSRSGDIGEGKPGVGRIAFQSKAKIVPCYHEGAQDMLPIGSHRLRTGKKLTLIVGDPVDMGDLYEQKECREVYQEIADRMIKAISDLRDEVRASHI